MNAATLPMHFEREEPGIAGSVLLAVLVHALLLSVLFFGVRWQSRPPETVSVELWVPPAAPVAERVEAKPEPKVEPPPPPPPPKPEPKVEAPRPPDIAIKEKATPKPKPEPPKPKPAPVKPKAEPARPRVDEAQIRMREDLAKALAREQASLKIDQEREMIKDQLTREQASASQRALSAYADKIKAKIRGNVLLPQDIKGNPEAIFDVVQLPTGEVLSAKLKKSSGVAAYDSAVERAILKSSPLPKPDKGELFSRELTLRFKPLE